MEQEIFINPYTDFGFKRLFGTENNKDILKNLSTMTEIPKGIDDQGIFKHLFDEAKFSKSSKNEQQKYEEDLKIYRDMVNVVDTAKYEGREEGIVQGRLEGIEQGKYKEKHENAIRMHENNIDIDVIEAVTGLSKNEIQNLIK